MAHLSHHHAYYEHHANQEWLIFPTTTLIREGRVFPVKTIEIFAWIVPVKLNYESTLERGGSKTQYFLKMTPDEISEAAARSILWKRC